MKPVRLLGLLALVIALAALAANCSSSNETPTSDHKPLHSEPDFIGDITEVHQIGENGVLGTALVETKVTTQDGQYADKYMVTVTDETLILEQDGKTVDHVSFEVLEPGQQARIWFSGPVRESYPAQVDAQQIMMVRPKNGDEVSLGQEFSLAVGQGALITEEGLKIKFVEVVEDSRCPRDVTCVWEGKVDVTIELTDGGSSYQLTLSQPGLSDQYSSETYKGYEFGFNVTPYPEAGRQISPDEYRLSLIINDAGTQQTGTLRGRVTIGPIWPVERPGDKFPIPPEVYEARKVMVYDKRGSKLIEKVDLGHDGGYAVELDAGTYMIDINRLGIDSSSDVPREVEIRSGEVVEVDIDIDTGIR
jgi:hypothetical protein